MERSKRKGGKAKQKRCNEKTEVGREEPSDPGKEGEKGEEGIEKEQHRWTGGG